MGDVVIVSQRFWKQASFIAVFASVVLFVVPVSGDREAGASAQLDDLRAQASQLADELEASRVKMSQIDEQYNVATIEAGKAKQDVADGEQVVKLSEAAVASAQVQAREQIVSAYVDGRDLGQELLLLDSAGEDLAVRREYLRSTSSKSVKALSNLQAANEDHQAQVANLERTKELSDDALALVNDQRTQMLKAIADNEELMGQLDGQIADLVQQEEQRRQAEEEAEAQAEQARRRSSSSQNAFVSAGRATNSRPASPNTPTPAASNPTAQGPAVIPAQNAATLTETQTASPTPSPTPTGQADGPAVVPISPSAQTLSPGAVSVGGSTKGSIAIEEAKRQLGKPYLWAGSGPDSFDCSGLTAWAWAAAGVSLPHSSTMQWAQTQRVSRDQLQPGDLVFFGSDLHHVGLYVGDGQMIEAPHSGAVVRYRSIDRTDYAGAGRVQ